MPMTRSIAVLTMLVLVPLFPLLPAAVAETQCVETLDVDACLSAGPTHESVCHEEPGGAECYEWNGEEALASVSSPVLNADAGAWYGERHETLYAEAGECTRIEVEGASEHGGTHASFGTIGAAGATGAEAGRGNATVVYEDPCGEELVPGLESGTYQYEFMYTRGVTAGAVNGMYLIISAWTYDQVVENEDGETVLCDRQVNGYLVFASGLAAPVVVDESHDSSC